MNKIGTIVNFRVSADTRKRLQQIARKQGVTVYKLLQCVSSTILKYCDDFSNADTLTSELIETLSHIKRWTNDVASIASLQTSEAIVFFNEKGKRPSCKTYAKRGTSWNKRQALQLIIDNTYPNMARQLQEYGNDYAEAISNLIQLAKSKSIDEEIETEFMSLQGYDTTPRETATPQARWERSANNDRDV